MISSCGLNKPTIFLHMRVPSLAKNNDGKTMISVTNLTRSTTANFAIRGGPTINAESSIFLLSLSVLLLFDFKLDCVVESVTLSTMSDDGDVLSSPLLSLLLELSVMQSWLFWILRNNCDWWLHFLILLFEAAEAKVKPFDGVVIVNAWVVFVVVAVKETKMNPRIVDKDRRCMFWFYETNNRKSN